MSLKLTQLSKRLGDFELSGLDLEVSEGEYFVLLGPSGVGKTILLELVAGLLKPDAGALDWRGDEITHLPPERRGIGIVYQDYALFPHLSVKSNIAYGPRAKRKPKPEVDQDVLSAAELTGLLELLDRDVTTLSGGEQQRVALARALAINPSLVLLDEPLAAIDQASRRGLRAELKSVHQQSRATFLHVTHDISEALQLGNRVGVMLDGVVQQVGTPAEIFQHPTDAKVAAFIGMSNVLEVDRTANSHCTVHGIEIHVGQREEPYDHIWIRPEEILLSADPFSSSARNQLACTVLDWELLDVHVAVRVESQDRASALRLTVLITFQSFEELGLAEGSRVFATFKSNAIQCF